MNNNSELEIKDDVFSYASVDEIDGTRFMRRNVEYSQVQRLPAAELTSLKDELVANIQAVSLQLGRLLQERHALRDEVAGRHVTIAQLLRVQETRASELGLQPAVHMSPAPRR